MIKKLLNKAASIFTPQDTQNLTSEEIDLYSTILKEDLTDYFSEIFADSGLPLPDEDPLIDKCLIITPDDGDSPDKIISTFTPTTTDGVEVMEISNIALAFNYPLALINPSNPALIMEAKNLCKTYNANFLHLMDNQDTHVKIRCDEKSYITLDLSSCILHPNIDPDYFERITAIQTIICHEHKDLDIETFDISYDKNIHGRTILRIEHTLPLTQEQEDRITDISRIELPDKEAGMDIVFQYIPASKLDLYQQLSIK